MIIRQNQNNSRDNPYCEPAIKEDHGNNIQKKEAIQYERSKIFDSILIRAMLSPSLRTTTPPSIFKKTL